MRLTNIVLGVLSMVSWPLVEAQAVDYPDMYLRGTVNNWGVSENYKFSRNENIYYLTVGELNGDFKISDSDWGVEFGWNGTDGNEISGDRKVTGRHGGPNWIGQCNSQITISFALNMSNTEEAPVLFSTTGEIISAEPVSLTSGTLPVLHINIYKEDGSFDNEVIDYNLSHKNYFSGEYWLEANGCEWIDGAEDVGSEEAPLALEMKARGNWTRIGFSKKPFKLKLGKKQSLLGMTKSKHYAILAHADDTYGYMRNFTGFNLGKRIGLPWTPWQQPVEVIINGDYRGLYFLTESIRVGDNRVMIQELEDNETQAALISGGYLVELDNYDEDEENQLRMEEKGCAWEPFRDVLRITFDTPEVYSDLQRRFIKDQFTAMNDFIGENSDELWSYMDLDDAARYYIVEEILSHVESYHGSTYLFRDRGEGQKWHFSPLWDCGNAFVGPTNDWFYNHDPYGNTWIASLRENGMFNAKVKETWKWFMSQKYEGIEQDLESYANSLKTAAQYDYNRWNNASTPYGGMPVVDNRNLDSKLQEVKNKLQQKTNWLKEQFGDYNNGFFAEPERDATEAAPLPDYAKGPSTIVTVVLNDSECEYYDLQGMRVAEPKIGQPYIVIRNGKATKAIR